MLCCWCNHSPLASGASTQSSSKTARTLAFSHRPGDFKGAVVLLFSEGAKSLFDLLWCRFFGRYQAIGAQGFALSEFRLYRHRKIAFQILNLSANTTLVVFRHIGGKGAEIEPAGTHIETRLLPGHTALQVFKRT